VQIPRSVFSLFHAVMAWYFKGLHKVIYCPHCTVASFKKLGGSGFCIYVNDATSMETTDKLCGKCCYVPLFHKQYGFLLDTDLYTSTMILALSDNNILLHKCCHMLLTRHGVWISNWIYWTQLVTTNSYKSLTNLYTLKITVTTACIKSYMSLLDIAR
jgi:hypothetical protein